MYKRNHSFLKAKIDKNLSFFTHDVGNENWLNIDPEEGPNLFRWEIIWCGVIAVKLRVEALRSSTNEDKL